MVTAIALAILLRTQSHSNVYAKAWAEISNTISTIYYDRSVRKPDINRLLAKYKSTALSATTRRAFETAINAMVGEFKDSHFEFFTTEDQGFYLMQGLSDPNAGEVPEFGAWFKERPEGFVVSMVLNGTAAAKADLRKGDIVKSVDGQPFSPVKALASKVGKTVKLGILRGDKHIVVGVPIAKASAMNLFLDATQSSVKVIENGGKRIGYIHLWTQSSDFFKEALQSAVQGRFTNTDAMILDLRDGFGGGYDGFADLFFRPDIVISFASPSMKTATHFGYQKPMVVLVNEGSRSAKEMLSYILQKGKRAKLIGSRTAGNVLAANPVPISDWAYLEVPVIDIHMDGVHLEHNGVTPDIVLPREFDDNGKDLYLARALDELTAPQAAAH